MDSTFQAMRELPSIPEIEGDTDAGGEGRSAVPGVLDYLKLVPATPLAHGALFSTKALTSAEWIVEMAFRMHGAVDTGLEDETSRGGRGLAFWYSKVSPLTPLSAYSQLIRR
jgi:hypothetical protein